MTKEALKAMVDEAEGFPMLPPTATQIARLTIDLSAPVKDIANKIEADKTLLDRMLTMVNAPFYGVSGPITRITDAVSLLGYKKVCNLAVGISALGIFPAKKEHGFDYGRFWEQSIYAGVCAGLIASRIPGDQPADVFSAALLQNVGILFMVRHQPLEYGTALGMAKGQNLDLVLAERDSWGGDHAQVGAEVCLKWQMPQLMAEVIRHHHFFELKGPLSDGTKAIIQIVNLSGLMAEFLEDTENEQLREKLDERGKEFFGFGPKTLDQVLEKVPELAQNIGTSFGIDMGGGGSAGGSGGAAEAQYHAVCPACEAEEQQGKFCGECGASLLVENAPRSKKRTSRKVLVAEDSIASRRAICFVIKKLGCIPIEATNGQEAIDIAKKDPPGMILLDVVMPGMNGLEALKRIREDKQLSDIPVVILTSLTDSETVVESVQAGANDYVIKPYTADTISDRIKKYMPDPKKK
ncbi:MAG: HDOD domain-containing protein [Candidatus Latescibacteria bacterium]|jgi:HD-like signal output (HDOD) protein/ActR/RegA family two-component response regulator|nr:HDOD domain-containing protein [Candidatus Latescibacterota bacterium]MBT4139887.1 HDOD domain-containing protein [Candidatus Latescibacterota bacterium]